MLPFFKCHSIVISLMRLSIDWLDLNVLATNLPAKNLYLKSGFKILGETPDFYRIDGKSVAEITMTLATKVEC